MVRDSTDAPLVSRDGVAVADYAIELGFTLHPDCTAKLFSEHLNALRFTRDVATVLLSLHRVNRGIPIQVGFFFR